MLRGGAVLEPEIMAPPFGEKAWKENRVREDGEVIVGASYDELKRELAGPAGSGRTRDRG